MDPCHSTYLMNPRKTKLSSRNNNNKRLKCPSSISCNLHACIGEERDRGKRLDIYGVMEAGFASLVLFYIYPVRALSDDGYVGYRSTNIVIMDSVVTFAQTTWWIPEAILKSMGHRVEWPLSSARTEFRFESTPLVSASDWRNEKKEDMGYDHKL